MPSDSDSQQESTKSIRLQWKPSGAAGVEFATDVLVNFTGNEFLVTFGRLLPPPFLDPEELPDELEIESLFRVVMSPAKWAEAVDAFNRQLATLRGRGVVPPASEQKQD